MKEETYMSTMVEKEMYFCQRCHKLPRFHAFQDITLKTNLCLYLKTFQIDGVKTRNQRIRAPPE